MNNGIAYLNALQGWVGQKDFSLERISLVAKQLGSPQNSFKSIHVSGTNGKGSTCAAVAAILGSAGHKVGLTTSPHLISITERIVIDGIPVSGSELSEVVEQVKTASEHLSIELSQFEAISLCAFLLFKQAKVDYAVVEVGLGGRLDATNIISKPDITAVVSISEDHQDILGETLSEIAREKAGIVKDNVPCIVGLVPDEALSAIKKVVSQHHQVDLALLEVDFSCKSLKQGQRIAQYVYKEPAFELVLDSHLLGEHQANNIGVAIRISRSLGVSATAIIKGIKQLRWPCRLEFCTWKGIEFLFDCAHNSAGILSLIRYLAQSAECPDCVIIGALQTKQWKKMALELSVIIKHWYVIEPESTQALSCERFSEFISKHELGDVQSFGKDYPNVIKHISSLGPGSQVLVTGSIYMVAAVRRELGIPIEALWRRETI